MNNSGSCSLEPGIFALGVVVLTRLPAMKNHIAFYAEKSLSIYSSNSRCSSISQYTRRVQHDCEAGFPPLPYSTAPYASDRNRRLECTQVCHSCHMPGAGSNVLGLVCAPSEQKHIGYDMSQLNHHMEH